GFGFFGEANWPGNRPGAAPASALRLYGAPVARRMQQGRARSGWNEGACDTFWHHAVAGGVTTTGMAWSSSKAEIETISPTSRASTRLCHKTVRRSSPSWPPSPVAAAATTIDWASIILPMTPPVVLADAMRMGLSPRFLAVIFWRLPKRTLLDVSEPVRATPS